MNYNNFNNKCSGLNDDYYYNNNNVNNDDMYFNSDSAMLPSFECEAELLNSNLWGEFHKLGTEMIITKIGRCMFPTLCVRFHGLEDNTKYAVSVEIKPSGCGRWTRSGGHWTPATPPSQSRIPPYEPLPFGTSTPHPLSPSTSSFWSQPFKFSNLKLTNNIYNTGNVVLRSMHKYIPVLKIRRLGKKPAERCFTFPETEFIAVTAYQSHDVAQLKIDKNPYAKGFRERERKRTKLKRQQEALSSSPSTKDTTLLTQIQPMDCSLSRDHGSGNESSAVSLSSSSPDISVCDSPPPEPSAKMPCFNNMQHFNSPEYLQYLMFEWTKSLVYADYHRPPWPPIYHHHHHHQQQQQQWNMLPHTWHSPLPQKICNDESKPKGSSFTIRALLQEN